MPSEVQITHTKNRYAAMFATLKAENRHALIPFTLLGWPDPETCLKTIDAFVAGGATALELGLAFSDPMADGPIIQQAAKEVLDQGFRVDNALALLRKIRERHPAIPIGLLVYHNMVLARGVDAFFRDMSIAGVDGILIADLPPEAADEVLPAAQTHGVNLIAMISVLTDENRLRQIARYAGGFLYVVSRLGITGVEDRHEHSLDETLQRIRAHTDLPACIGFGISQPEHVQKMLALGADGVIIGSALIRLIRELGEGYPMEPVSRYLQDLSN